MLQTFSDIQSPFAAFRAHLKTIPPGDDPIDMTIGAPRHSPPGFVAEKLNEAIATAAEYPAIAGTPALQQAILAWAQKRFKGLEGKINQSCCLPLNGSREGLFYAIFMARSRRLDIENPVVLLPNPYYQVYGAAALAAGATPWFLNATEENGFLPDITAVPEDLLSRSIACYICSPSNPEGAVADRPYLETAIASARQYDFMLFSDECYSEIYRQQKPLSALEVAAGTSDGLTNVCAFNSLSKRSNVPGIRSGLMLGDPTFMKAFTSFRNVAGPQIAGPIQHLSTALWQDESHVEENRRLYNEKFALAKNILGERYSLTIPAGGFFLWLKMSEFGGGIAAATTLWKGCGVKLLPGAYLSQPDHNGINPGQDYVRMALVGSAEQTEDALQKIIRVMG